MRELGDVDCLGEPGGGGHRQCLQGRPHALAGQLGAVQVPDRADDVGGVGALPAAGGHQPGLLAVLQQPVENRALQAVLGQPRPEPGQHAVVEAGVRQLHPEGVFPVDRAYRHRRRLPVGEVLGELQHRNQRQGARREARRPAHPERLGERLVGEDFREPVADPYRQGALGERGAGHRRGLLGNRWQALGPHRHLHHPRGRTTGKATAQAIIAYSADPASGIAHQSQRGSQNPHIRQRRLSLIINPGSSAELVDLTP
ncbi:hypothetical protein OG331_04580 [Streptomyces sp. NBC_01017]|nr:hypothetical protein OG331_04580 [Streptomyces sp. NBC_01017]